MAILTITDGKIPFFGVKPLEPAPPLPLDLHPFMRRIKRIQRVIFRRMDRDDIKTERTIQRWEDIHNDAVNEITLRGFNYVRYLNNGAF